MSPLGDAARSELAETAYRETKAHEADFQRRVQEARAERDRAIAEKNGVFLPPGSGDAGIQLRFYPNGINFGRTIEDGELTQIDLVVPVRQIQHMLVGGVPGSGKTVWLHALVSQLQASNEVERLFLIDLKGGVEFVRYDGLWNVAICRDIERVADVFQELVAVLRERLQQLRTRKQRTWPGQRIFVVVDEYAMLHGFIGEAKAKGQKELAVRVSNDLRELVLMARAAGIVLICALQKPTSDAIDSNLKANMGFRACFLVKTRQAAEAVLEASGDDLPIDPRNLRVGRFVLDDGRAYRRIQAPITPGLDLSGGW
ncbi:broad-specificity NMP kinase [Bradyrhizobium sp. USDA 4501]